MDYAFDLASAQKSIWHYCTFLPQIFSLSLQLHICCIFFVFCLLTIDTRESHWCLNFLLYSATWLYSILFMYSFINIVKSNSLCWIILFFFWYTTIPHSDNTLIFSFPTVVAVISPSWFNTLVKSSRTILNNNSNGKYLNFVADFIDKCLSFPLWC